MATTAEFYALPADEQALRVAEWQIERGKCPQCGGDPDECSDPQKPWYPQRSICYPTMERSAAQRRWEALHDEKAGQWHDGTFESWAKDRSDQYPYHRDDGVNIWVAPFKSDGPDFLRRSLDEDDESESESPDEQ